MKPVPVFHYPAGIEETYQKARRLEWITIGYLIATAILIFLTMGSSQAMRTAFFDDIISIVPAAAFLIGNRVARKGPHPDFPYGRHRATSIAHLTAAMALMGMGAFLLFEAAMKFTSGEKPTIGGFNLFGQMVWGGWPMLAAVAFTGLPSVLLGRMKLKLAPKLHDKVLFADSKMMKADWMVALATAGAVVGIGFGLWWADVLAAALVSADILHDGFQTLKVATADLIDRKPEKTDQTGMEQLPSKVETLLKELDWVEDAAVRMREEGHVFMGEAYVIPRPGTRDLAGRLEQALEEARGLDWRVHHLVIQPVKKLTGR